MFIIGLTGGIASGKSTVSAWFQEKGITVIDADAIAREVVQPGTVGLQKITEVFGRTILLEDGHLNRPAMAAIVFNDEKAREALNAILHSEIRASMEACKEKARGRGEKLVVYDVPLLIESNWQSMVNEVWLVYTDRKLQKERLIKRSGYTEKEAEARINSQLSLEEKVKHCQVKIDNNKTEIELYEQLEHLWHTRLKPIVLEEE